MPVDLTPFLAATPVVDADHPAVRAQAGVLAVGPVGEQNLAAACFQWVRDRILHSFDIDRGPVTCRASDVLRHGTGICFAKSHLLAALLRANGVAAGFCYQRLSLDDLGPPFTLHGMVAVWLPDHGWYRCDPRGNRGAVNAQFIPPAECLAYRPSLDGEQDIPGLFPDPLPQVIDALQGSPDLARLKTNLPDMDSLS